MIMNIEKTISEHAVSDILTPMLESQDRIVTEDVAPLFNKATGLYTPPASGTVTTTIEESRSVITAIIRKAWTATLTMLGGASVIGYIIAAYTYLRNRLQGNETYGIPDRRSEISGSSPLAANLALLNDRKISDLGDVPDGMSLAQLVGGYYGSLTKIEDTNHGWIMNKSVLSVFPNLTQITLNCKEAYVALGNVENLTLLQMPELELFNTYQSQLTSGEYQGTTADFRKLKETYSGILVNAPYLTENPFRDLETIHPRYGYQSMTILGNTAIDTIDLPNLKKVNASGGCGIIQGGSVRVIKCEALESCTSNYNGHATYSAGLIAGSLPNLEELWLGKLTGTGYITPNSSVMPSTPKLKKVVLGEGTSTSVTLNGWTPSAETIADADFLPNFKEFIAKRLKGGYAIGQGPTLTLSQAVHNAITAAEDDYHIREIITQKGWTISPAPN